MDGAGRTFRGSPQTPAHKHTHVFNFMGVQVSAGQSQTLLPPASTCSWVPHNVLFLCPFSTSLPPTLNCGHHHWCLPPHVGHCVVSDSIWFALFAFVFSLSRSCSRVVVFSSCAASKGFSHLSSFPLFFLAFFPPPFSLFS